MIEIHYFASIRERLGCERESLEVGSGAITVAALVDILIVLHGERWQRVLQDERVLMAVNQQVASLQSSIKDGDEVAFFPPVTGG